MARSQLTRNTRILCQWKKAAGSRKSGIADDQRSVVQWRMGIKNGYQKIVVDSGIETYPTFDVGLQSDFTFKNQQGACLLRGECRRRQHNFVIPFFAEWIVRTLFIEHKPVSKMGQSRADLVLEEDDDRESKIYRRIPHHPLKRCQLEVGGDPVKKSDEEEPTSHLGCSRSAHETQYLVDQ